MNIGEESENSAGIAIFQRGTGVPYATILDKDGDGVFDLLTYSARDVSGKHLFEVEDYGMDGQADFKFNSQTGQAWVFYENEWREAHRPKTESIYKNWRK